MRTQLLSTRGLRALVAAVGVAALVYGCSGGSSSDPRLRLISFNLDGVTRAFLNERLIFTFSAPVDPESVDIQTIRIRYDASMIDIDGDCLPDNPANNNAVPEGEFIVDENRVIFQPRIPTTPGNNDVGLFPTHDIDPTPDPADCQRTQELVVTYMVTIPGFSETNPNTVVTKRDRKPLVESFSSTFTTLRDETFPPMISLDSFVDLRPGAPRFVEMVDPAPGSAGVPLDASVSLRFTEALLPSSLTSESVFLVGVGPRSGAEERIPAEIRIDQVENIVTLSPTIELPADVEIRAKFTNALLDFGSNPLDVPEDVVFPSFRTRAVAVQGPFAIRENFDDTTNRDDLETSADWAGALPGFLIAGNGGGTAFMGEFIFDPGSPEAITFDTGDYDPFNPLPAFEFSTFFLGEDATLRVIGENVLIIKATGDLIVAGTIDVRGESANSVEQGAILGTEGGQGAAGGGNGGDGGTVELENGTDGQGARLLGGLNRFPGGGGGSVALACAAGAETGGGGGGNHRSGATAGRDDDGNPGGGAPAGAVYGSDALDPFNGTLTAGSGGGGAGTTCFAGVVYPGAGGGAGGGAVWLQADGALEVSGNVLADGGDGGANNFFVNNVGGAGGAGGSGGAILLEGISSVASVAGAQVSANRGAEGLAGESGGANDGSGGSGGSGRIRFESLGPITVDGTVSPAPAQGPYELAGNTSVGTSQWFNTGVFFPDYSFQILGRNGGGSQDNGNFFPDPDSAIRYFFQGAPPDPDDPSVPDEENVRPAVGEFSDDIDDVDDCQFIRVKVVLTWPVPIGANTPTVNFFQFQFTHAGGRSSGL